MVVSDAQLEGLRALGASTRPTILQRTDQNFVDGVLRELSEQADFAPHVARKMGRDGLLKLSQPVHRTFHLLLLEAFCERLGNPRLDAARIDSAGIVVRRISASTRRDGDEILEGWMQDGDAPRGWVPLLGEGDLRLDPEPGRRVLSGRTGNAEIDRRLSLLRGAEPGLREAVSPFFVAPPEVCAQAGATALYGVIPLTSDEFPDASSTPPRLDAERVSAHLSEILMNRTNRGVDHPLYGAWLGRTFVPSASAAEGASAGLQRLLLCLRQLSLELDVFGPDAGARRLRALLDEIELPMAEGDPVRAGSLLADASSALLAGEGRPVTMPIVWPAISSALRGELVEEVGARLSERLAALGPAHETRFAQSDRHYRAQAFIRVRRQDGCPPDLVWSRPSEPFSIAAWYEGGDTPPVPIPLPEPRSLSDLKPNVAFSVPESLMNQLKHTSMAGLIDGDSGSEDGPNLGIEWLCHFSIPIITLCAFVVLNIFLQLLNIIFFWLPFVKICIPIPKPDAPAPPSSGGG